MRAGSCFNIQREWSELYMKQEKKKKEFSKRLLVQESLLIWI
nr:MAG TPA: hypothetical protein [Caudoviricetes sp.]